MRNGAVIGKLNLPAAKTASGIWSLRAQSEFIRGLIWRISQPIQSGLILWIDASNASSVTLNGSSVSAITDLSSGGKTIDQSTAANQPAYSTAAKNGLNTITFTAANSHFLNLTSTTIPSSFTTFRVMQRTASSQHSIGIGQTASSLYDCWWFNDNTVYHRSNSSAFTAHNSSSSTGWFYFSTRRNGTSDVIVRRNGSDFGLVNSGAGITNAVSGSWNTIGRTQTGAGTNTYSAGDIGELLLYDRALTDNEILAMEAYLAAKWAI